MKQNQLGTTLGINPFIEVSHNLPKFIEYKILKVQFNENVFKILCAVFHFYENISINCEFAGMEWYLHLLCDNEDNFRGMVFGDIFFKLYIIAKFENI